LAQAGPDQSVNCYENGVATMAAIGVGEWSWASGLTATIDQPSIPTSTISGFPSAGTYTLVWTTQDGSCTDEVEIVVGDDCQCPIAGNTIVQPNPSEYCGAGVDVTITGSEPTPTGGVYLWEYDSGSGFVTASGDFSSKDYEATNLGVGVHTFRRRYTISTPIACEDISDVVTITVFELAQAGPDQSVNCYENGVATMAAIGVGEWSWASGLTATINQPSNPASTISDFPSAGTYTLVWTTQDGSCTDEVEIVVGEDCPCPIAGNTIFQPNPSEFCGAGVEVTIAGSQPTPSGGTGTFRWEYSLNGGNFMPANGLFDQRDYSTESLGVGVHRFRRIYAITSPLSCSDISNEVEIIVYEAANAGPDRSVECFSEGSATMAAVGEGQWSWTSTLEASIDQVTNGNATINNFPQAGVYELMWTTDEGECTDIVQIIVGDDCFECEIMDNTIAQPIPSDYCEISPEMPIVGGMALPTGGVYSWEYSFNGSVFVEAVGISNGLNYNTVELQPGEHRFRRRYTLSTNPLCEDVSDIVEIMVSEAVDAGEDQDLSCTRINEVEVIMSALGNGYWTQDNLNPEMVQFSDLNNAEAILTGFTTPGVYTFIWSNSVCDDEMTIVIGEDKDAGEDQFVDCFVDGEVIMNALGNGTWTPGSNNPGTVLMSSTTDPQAIITNFSINGIYEFIWTVDGCEDIVLIEVGDACPCFVESNSILDDVDDVFCKTTGELLIVGEEALPLGGTYSWEISIKGSAFTSAPGINNERDYNASNFGEGTYILRRIYTLNIDGVECSDVSSEIEFYVFDKKQTPGEIYFSPDPVCLGDSLILEVDFNPNLIYNWEIMSGAGRVLYALDSMAMIVVESPGTLMVSVTQYLDGCENNIQSTSSEIEITVLDTPKPYLGQDTTFCELDETFTIFPGDFESYEWHNGSSDDQFEVEGEGIYELTVVDSMGCVGYDMVNIKSFCCEFAHPNIFVADSRGSNSSFKVTDIYDCVIEAELYIYDRWGNLVFIGDGLDSWDGTFKGKFVEQGVYVFIYKYKALDADRQEFEDEVSGDVTVLR
ncbi:MAG: gliding motility-associated C-terminal domain-containing protein, partial [Saprospiraceae bacterium]|nr:gliding motility-associated C-terminal domain-containing protein [Saprospiraceae bacterium]